MRALLLTVGALLLFASPAAAARYASPSGAASGSCATTATACTLTYAVNSAPASSEIIVLPGNYNVTAALSLPATSYIHGLAGSSRPVINTTVTSSGLSTTGVGASHIKDLEINGPSTNGVVFLNDAGGVVENLVVHATGTSTIGLVEYGTSGASTIRDTIATAAGPNSIAFEFAGVTSHARNLTAWATGTNSTGIDSFSSYFNVGMSCIGQGAGTVDLVGSIVHGEGQDLWVNKAGSACGPTPTLAVAYTNFQTKKETNATVNTAGGHNLALAPSTIFVASGADFHELVGAGTIGAGLEDAFTGTQDVDDLPRARGTIDMGAAEFFAPDVTVLPGTTGPTFNGTVDTHGVDTTAVFEFGPDASYGSLSSAVALAAASTASEVHLTPPGLDPSAAVHYRLKASQGNANYTRTVTSDDALYSPPPPPAPAEGTPPATPPPTGSTLKPALKFADLVRLPSAKSCIRRARLRLVLHKVKGVKIASLQIKVTGRRTRTVRGKALSRPILIGHPAKGRFTIAVAVNTASGKKLTGKRRYRGC